MRFNSGFTIIEALVTVAVLAILSVAVVTFLPLVVNVNRSSVVDQQSTTLVKGYFEDLRRAWSDPAAYEAGDPGTLSAASGCDTPQVSSPATGDAYKTVSLTCETTTYLLRLGRP